jgi:hypothetical protein
MAPDLHYYATVQNGVVNVESGYALSGSDLVRVLRSRDGAYVAVPRSHLWPSQESALVNLLDRQRAVLAEKSQSAKNEHKNLQAVIQEQHHVAPYCLSCSCEHVLDRHIPPRQVARITLAKM